MRLVNVLAMAVVASTVVVAAFAARHAAGAEPARAAPIDRPWLERLDAPIRELSIFRRRDGFVEEAARLAGRDGAIGVLRSPGAPLPATRTLVARDADAFAREVARRFADAPTAAALARPTPLAADGDRVGGFVARVRVGQKSCDFAIAGYRDAAAAAISALARVIVCDPAGALTPPDIRVAGLLSGAGDAR